MVSKCCDSTTDGSLSGDHRGDVHAGPVAGDRSRCAHRDGVVSLPHLTERLVSPEHHVHYLPLQRKIEPPSFTSKTCPATGTACVMGC